jgi:DNA-directed RNA polymerase specialized sigma24 family protein
VAKREKQNAGNVSGDPLAVEMGRIAKLLALYMVKDVEDESKKVSRLNAVGFSPEEIALMLDKTAGNVRVQLSQAKKKREK